VSFILLTFGVNQNIKIMLINFSHPAFKDENGKEVVFQLEGKMEVCPRCQGTGSHVREDIDDSRLVDMYHEDGDYEALDAYFKGSMDVICTQCNGRNVVPVPVLDEEMQKEIDEWNQAEWEYQREVAAERRMGA
jgi:hypothetical protein